MCCVSEWGVVCESVCARECVGVWLSREDPLERVEESCCVGVLREPNCRLSLSLPILSLALASLACTEATTVCGVWVVGCVGDNSCVRETESAPLDELSLSLTVSLSSRPYNVRATVSLGGDMRACA